MPPRDPGEWFHTSFGTGFVHSVTYVIGSSNYHGLFAYQSHRPTMTVVVTTNGTCLELLKDGTARPIKIHSKRASAW